MKTLSVIFVATAMLLACNYQACAAPAKAGFYLPDYLTEVSIRFREVSDLIILPVIINDSIHVNLILDTGCRNLVLFGKRFQKLFNIQKDTKVQFSGLGSGKAVVGSLSLNNTVSIGAVIGELIPVVIIPTQNLFGNFTNVHGVIGYDIFTKFEVEINPRQQRITFRPAALATLPASYTRVPIRISDSRPVVDCSVVLDKDRTQMCDLMIDTGSTLGLLLKTTDLSYYETDTPSTILGRGLNGDIEGFETITEQLRLSSLELNHLKTGIIKSRWHNHASIGMAILKEYSLVLNYCKGYAGFLKL